MTQGTTALSTDLAVVLDDRDDALTGPGHDDAWREWLRISNSLALRAGPMSITTVSQALAAVKTAAGGDATPATAAAAPVEESAQSVADLPLPWREQAAKAFSVAELDLLHRLAATRAVPVPRVGDEVDGIVVDLAWPNLHIAVFIDPDPDTRHDLETAGWQVLGPDLEPLLAALTAAGATEGH